MVIYFLEKKVFDLSVLKLLFDLDSKKKRIYDYFKNEITLINCDLMTKNDLLLVHTHAYVEKLYSKKNIEIINAVFELSKYSPIKLDYKLACLVRDRMLQEAKAVYLTCKKTVQSSQNIFYIGGGMHHAESDSGYGFCLINDVAIAIKKLQQEKIIKSAWIIDLDAHMGNGNSEIFKNDSTVKTLSIHMQNQWPFNQNRPIVDSDIQLGLLKDQENFYLSILSEGLEQLLKESKNIPDIAIIIQGADPYEKDELESSSDLQLSLKQMKQRDKKVYCFLKELKIPQTYLMAGGYGELAHEPYVHFLNFVSIS